MANLKIRTFRGLEASPASTVTIPVGVLRFAANLIPLRAIAAMKAEGIDVEAIVRAADDPSVRGTLVEFEDHETGQRTIVAVE